MKRFFALFALVCALAVAPAARAQPLTADPGYLDLTRMDALFGQEPTVEIDLRGSLLQMVTRAARSDDPDLAAMLGRMRAVQVRIFPLTARSQTSARSRAADLMRGLERGGWESFVRVRQDGQFVNMLVRPRGTDGTISGLVVSVIDEDDDEPQAVFINIVGDVDPARLGEIGRRVGVPNLPTPPRPPAAPRPPRRNDD